MLKYFIFLAAIALPMCAQDMPDGPGKETAVHVCTNCHGAEMFASSRMSKSGWDAVIGQMVNNGLTISDADYDTVLTYLSTAMGTAKPKTNVNTASSADLVKGLGVTQKQADAIVAYREKNGAFKDIDGLKKVDGLDAAAIDGKKTVIAF